MLVHLRQSTFDSGFPDRECILNNVEEWRIGRQSLNTQQLMLHGDVPMAAGIIENQGCRPVYQRHNRGQESIESGSESVS